MKRGILFLLIVLSVTLHAQDAKTLFATIPDSFTPLLTKNDRADFIDFLESDMKARVKNKFDSISEMTDLTPSYIRIQMTSRSSWEMKVLPMNDSVIICTVSTACAPVCDSHVRFYTSNWKELPASDYLTLPSMDNFFTTSTSLEAYDRESLKSKADMLLLKAELSKEEALLTFTFTTPDYLEQSEAKKLSEMVRSNLVYKWDQRFEPIP